MLWAIAVVGCNQQAGTTTASTATIERGDIEQTVSALGKLVPKTYVDVGAQISGQLSRVHVEIGAQVERGQLLAEIDPRLAESRVRAEQARLASLAAQLGERRAELKLNEQQHVRNVTLQKRGLVSVDQRDISAAAVAVAESRIQSLQAQVTEAQSTLEGNQTSLSYAKIYAPISGTVVSQTALEGQTLNASQMAPIIVRVADLSTMTVIAQVAEADVGKIRTGMPVFFTTLGMPDRRWTSTVRQVLPTPQVLNEVVLFNVLIDVQNENTFFLPDMTAQVFFEQRAARDVPLVPLGALEPVAGKPREFLVQVVGKGETHEARSVRIGIRNRNVAEVKSGLVAGERVWVAAPVAPSAPGGERQRRSPLGTGGGRSR